MLTAMNIKRLFVVALLLLAASFAWAELPDKDARLSPQEIFPLAQRYCGSCHALPPPNILPKRSWPQVINTMVELTRDYTGTDVIPEQVVPHIIALYFGMAPEELPALPYIDTASASAEFREQLLGPSTPIPQVVSIKRVDLGEHYPGLTFLVCDGEAGQVNLARAKWEDGRLQWSETKLAEVDIPITTQVVDFNGNGRLDILVSDLGILPPVEQRAGKVYVLEQDENGEFHPRLLLDGLGRVTDARAADLTGNGRLDLAVAVFGGRGVGEAFWLENMGDGKFERRELLSLSGALNLTPVDLNGNGRLDLVTLVAQEHQVVFAFINEGNGRFSPMELARAEHPMFGATSLLIHDMNGSGRPDILFSNGDAFDTQNDPKPYHGVQWLENMGDLQFRYRDIGRFYGAANMAIGDVSGNGAKDVVVSSWVNVWEDAKRQSLVWFENDGEGNFTPRPISGNIGSMVPIELVDITGNGRLDMLTGAFRMDIMRAIAMDEPVPGDQVNPRLRFYQNLAP